MRYREVSLMLTKRQTLPAQPLKASRFQRLLARIYAHKYFYAMLFLAMGTLILFRYVPIYGVQLAFKKFTYRKGVWGSPWVGLDNFRALFESSVFRRVIFNTISISIGRIASTFFVPVVIALLLNEIKGTRFKRLVQTTMYLPHFLSWVIISGMVYSLLTINGGFFNKIIASLGGRPINFLLEPAWFRPILYISSAWKETGWESIIYLAALAGINPELYEAAIVDGAGRSRQMLHITWPGIKSTVVIMLILTVSRVMSAGFEQVFTLYSSPVYSVGDIIDTFVYREYYLKGNFGVGTAAGLFQSLINLTMVVVANRVAKWINDGEGLY